VEGIWHRLPSRHRPEKKQEEGRRRGGEEVGEGRRRGCASPPPPHRRVYSGEYEFGCDIHDYHSSVYAREILVGILGDASRSLNNCLATYSFSFPLIMIKENALINNYSCLSNALIKDTRLLARTGKNLDKLQAAGSFLMKVFGALAVWHQSKDLFSIPS
jgi:hypothetical protein